MNILRQAFERYVMPGLVFQSLVIGGGYGTGRELVEFFLKQGPRGALYAMLVATIIWSCVLAISFEFARLTRSYDYRTFLDRLLGKGWYAYELTYLLGMVLIVSVVAAASGEVVGQMLGVSRSYGVLFLAVSVVTLASFGTLFVERGMSWSSIALSIVYVLVIVWSLTRYGEAIKSSLSGRSTDSGWLLSGIRYAAYNIGTLPAILFATRHIVSRREAVAAGLIGGPIAMFPALFICLSMLAFYPQVLSASVPVNVVLGALGSKPLHVAFQIILLGTLIATALGIVHGFNERIAGVLATRGRRLPGVARLGLGTAILVTSVLVADSFSLIELISKGYGTITWAFLATFVLPVLTIGVWKLRKASSNEIT